MELPPQGDKLHKSSDHLEKEDVQLYSVGTRDTLASHDGVLLSCASHANKVPKLARPPPSPLPPLSHSLCSSFLSNTLLWKLQEPWSLCAFSSLSSSLGVHGAPPGFHCAAAWKFSQALSCGSNRLTFFCFLFLITVLHCQMSSVLKTTSSYILFIFLLSYVRG